MAKSKKANGGLVTRIVAIALAVLTFVSMAFKFVVGTIKVGNTKTSEAGSFSDWNEILGGSGDNLGWWKTAKVFMIIAFVVVAVLAVIAVIQFFYNHKVLSMIMKFGGIVGIVVAVAFIALFIVGCIVLGEESYGVAITYGPHAGPIVLALSAIGASVCATLSAKK